MASPLVLHAKAFLAANPHLTAVVTPSFGKEGKFPNAPGGHHPDLATWKKRILSVPFDHPGWETATGWGIILSGSPGLLCVDIDHREHLTSELSVELGIYSGMTYPTIRGRHHWFWCPDEEPFKLKAPWGEAWLGQVRFVAMGGSVGRGVPDDWMVPPPSADLTRLLNPSLPAANGQPSKPVRLDHYDPPPPAVKISTDQPIPEGARNDTLFNLACDLVRNGVRAPRSLVKELRAIPVEGKLPVAEYEAIARSAVAANPPPPEPPPVEEPPPDDFPHQGTPAAPKPDKPALADTDYRLGAYTTMGEEIVCADGTIVAHLNLPPCRPSDWPYSNGYWEYVRFWQQAIRYPGLPAVEICGQAQINDYLDAQPEPIHIRPMDGGHLILPPPDNVGRLLAKSGGGKTWAALELVNQSKIRTLYIATESIEDVLKRAKDLGRFVYTDAVFYTRPQPAHRLAELADQHRAEMIVIDVQADLLEGVNENWQEAVHRLKHIVHTIGNNRSVLTCHHLAKNENPEGEDGGRGASGFRAMSWIDYGLKLTREEDELHIDIKPSKVKAGRWPERGTPHPHLDRRPHIPSRPHPRQKRPRRQPGRTRRRPRRRHHRGRQLPETLPPLP